MNCDMMYDFNVLVMTDLKTPLHFSLDNIFEMVQSYIHKFIHKDFSGNGIMFSVVTSI